MLSGLDRSIAAANGYSIPHPLRTGAAIHPGNSGRPVLDAKRRVMGIADEIATGGTRRPDLHWVGFAVSIDVSRASSPS